MYNFAMMNNHQPIPTSQMGYNQVKINDGKQQKQRDPEQKRIFQGSGKKGIADYRCRGFDGQSFDCESRGKRRNELHE